MVKQLQQQQDDPVEKTKSLISALNYVSRDLPLPSHLYDSVSSIYHGSVSDFSPPPLPVSGVSSIYFSSIFGFVDFCGAVNPISGPLLLRLLPWSFLLPFSDSLFLLIVYEVSDRIYWFFLSVSGIVSVLSLMSFTFKDFATICALANVQRVFASNWRLQNNCFTPNGGDLMSEFEDALLKQRPNCESGSRLAELKETRYKSRIQNRLSELEGDC